MFHFFNRWQNNQIWHRLVGKPHPRASSDQVQNVGRQSKWQNFISIFLQKLICLLRSVTSSLLAKCKAIAFLGVVSVCQIMTTSIPILLLCCCRWRASISSQRDSNPQRLLVWERLWAARWNSWKVRVVLCEEASVRWWMKCPGGVYVDGMLLSYHFYCWIWPNVY